MRIPLIVRAPGIRGGERRSGLIESIDLYPTLCELAGLKKPDHLQGNSFVGLMKDADAKWKSTAVGRFQNGDTIRTDQFRFTEYRNGKDVLTSRMLYDHANDPGENANVAQEPSRRGEATGQAVKSPEGPLTNRETKED